MASGRTFDRLRLQKRGTGLEYFTIGWNVVAAAVAVTAGVAAGSIALVGFGLDSIIETVATGMLLWWFRLEASGRVSTEENTMIARRILFGVGVTFFLLALYILNESGSKLFYREKPETSTPGLVLSGLALIITVVLAVMKLRTAKALESSALRADARETALRGYLSLTLFLGLFLHAGFGFWWADPAAALFMLPFVVREGWKAIEESKGTSYGTETKKKIL